MRKLIRRESYMQWLANLKDSDLIKVLSGVRRSGKSTIFKMFADELKNDVSEKQIQTYNFEEIATVKIGDYIALHDFISKKLVPNKMNYIFLDEIQNVDSFEKLIDSLYVKENVDLYITGSNAYFLSGEFATFLTGRYMEKNVLPFSFAEYTKVMKNPPNSTKIQTLADFLWTGGLPQSLTLRDRAPEEAEQFATSVLNTIIEKDIFFRHRINNKEVFNRVINFIFDSIGSPISPRSISNSLKSSGTEIDKETVAKYLDYLCEAFLMYKVPRFEIKGKGLLQTLEKYYLVDNGFRRARLGKDSASDRGHLLENAVYLELKRRNKEVFVGKFRDKEVDFVVRDKNDYISYYQVAYSVIDQKTLERELAPLLAIKDSNAKFLLTADDDINPVYNGIRKLNVEKWLLGGDE